MLVITKKQIDAFSKARMRSFIARSVKRIETLGNLHFTNISDEEKRRFVEQTVLTSKKYGIEREIDVLEFFNFVIAVVWKSGSEVWPSGSKEILEDTMLTGKQKIDRLSNLALFSGE